MPRVCQVTGKKTQVGNAVARRGLPKKKGGVGLKITGRTKRKFKPNLQKIRILTPDGTVMRIRVSTKVIKSGVIKLKKGDKVVTFPLVKALKGRNRAHLAKLKGQDGAEAPAHKDAL